MTAHKSLKWVWTIKKFFIEFISSSRDREVKIVQIIQDSRRITKSDGKAMSKLVSTNKILK